MVLDILWDLVCRYCLEDRQDLAHLLIPVNLLIPVVLVVLSILSIPPDLSHLEGLYYPPDPLNLVLRYSTYLRVRRRPDVPDDLADLGDTHNHTVDI
jgi:hypothetical protein